MKIGDIMNSQEALLSSSDPDEVLVAYLSLVEQHCIHLVSYLKIKVKTENW